MLDRSLREGDLDELEDIREPNAQIKTFSTLGHRVDSTDPSDMRGSSPTLQEALLDIEEEDADAEAKSWGHSMDGPPMSRYGNVRCNVSCNTTSAHENEILAAMERINASIRENTDSIRHLGARVAVVENDLRALAIDIEGRRAGAAVMASVNGGHNADVALGASVRHRPHELYLPSSPDANQPMSLSQVTGNALLARSDLR